MEKEEEQVSFNEILHPSKQVYSYNGKGRRARSYKVRSFIKNQLPAKYKSLYSTARGAQTQYIDINEPNPRYKITVGKKARQLKLPVSQTKEEFFHSLITDEQEEFLNKTFGSWSQYSFVLGYADIFFADCFIHTLKFFPFYKQIMCDFSPEISVPDYDIEMKYDYWSRNESDYDSTSFVEGEIIGMDTYHKLDIPVIHLTTKSEKEDQEEKEYDRIIKSNINTEFDSRSITDPSSKTSLDPNTISIIQDTNPFYLKY